jgi:hypothetical protein
LQSFFLKNHLDEKKINNKLNENSVEKQNKSIITAPGNCDSMVTVFIRFIKEDFLWLRGEEEEINK